MPLATSVPEENSRRSHFEEVCKREEKASKEKLSLEQQLRIERRERQKALTQLGEAEVRTKNELEVVKAGTEVVFFPYASNLVMTAAESCVALTIMVSRQ